MSYKAQFFNFLLTICCAFNLQVVSCTSIETVKKLHSDLLLDYDKTVRPMKNQDRTLLVEFGLSLVEIAYLDTKTGNMLMNTWLQMSWQDDQLRWNSKEYQGTSDIKLPLTSIWRPDVRLYNSLESQTDNSVNAVIESNGHVTVVMPAQYEVTCRHEFRGNVWSCPFKFSSWAYSGSEVDVVAQTGKSGINMENYIHSDYYAVVSHSGERQVNKYKCCREPYPSMDYLLKLRGKMGPSLLGKRRRRK